MVAGGKIVTVVVSCDTRDSVRVSGQGRLTSDSRHLPDLDGFVGAATGSCQRLLTIASRHLPDFDDLVAAATGNMLDIWTVVNTVDIPVKSSIFSTHHTFENKWSKRQ